MTGRDGGETLRRAGLVAGWLTALGLLGGLIMFYVAEPHLRAEFFFDEAWRADLIRSSRPLERYRTNNTPIPPLWIAVLKVMRVALPDGFTGMRVQNLFLDATFPLTVGVLAALVVGWQHRARAIAASVAATVLTAVVMAVSGLAIYLNDYAFQATAVALAVVACMAADRGTIRPVWAAAGIVLLPLATLGGLVVLPALAVWWVTRDPRPPTPRSWAGRLAVPAGGAAMALVMYLWLYRPQIDSGLESFWGAATLRGGTRSVGAVLVDIPRTLAVNVVPPRFESARNVGVGLLIMLAAVAGLPALRAAWKWLPWIVLTSWPVAALLSLAADWPVTFVRVNLPFVWLWYLSALVGIASVLGRALRRESVGFAVCAVAALGLVPSRVVASNATFARGLYRDLGVIAASPYEHNVVLSYHFMSHFYVDDELKNLSGSPDRFTVVREETGSDELYATPDQAAIDAGWEPGDAVWCVVPYEIGPDASERVCHIALPGLTQSYSERLERAWIIGWFPVEGG